MTHNSFVIKTRQLIFITRLRTPLTWAVGVVAMLIIVPLIVLSRLRLSPDTSPIP